MSLLGLMTEAWMGKRLGEEKRIPKFVTDAFFERMHVTAFDKFPAM
jgi:hypothetical protein